MNREEFLSKIKDCSFDIFNCDGRHADYVVKDGNGQAWMIERADYREDDICATACAYIKDHEWAKPVKAFPVFGVCGYVSRQEETDEDKLKIALDQIDEARSLIDAGNTKEGAAHLRQASMTILKEGQ